MTWYVSQIETNCERKAEKLAPSFGITAFLPMIEQKFTAMGRSMSRPVLMFPGYLFLNFSNLDLWKRARRDGFVFLRLLGAGEDRIEAVKDRVVEELMARHVNGVVPLVEPKSQFHEGQRVRVARGKYADVMALVHSTAHQRVSLLMKMFNQEIRVELDESLVVAA